MTKASRSRVDIRRASRDELGAVDALLRASGGRPLPRDIYASNVLVALDAGAVIGAVGLEVVGRTGMALWAAVAEGRVSEGVRASLVRSLVARAQELGLREIYASNSVASVRLEDFVFVPVAAGRVPHAVRLRPWYPRPTDGDAPLHHLDLESRI